MEKIFTSTKNSNPLKTGTSFYGLILNKVNPTITQIPITNPKSNKSTKNRLLKLDTKITQV